MPARVIMGVCACNPPPPILLFQREQNGRWNITVLLLLPYLMTAVIATVWCSLAVCVSLPFDPSNTTQVQQTHSLCHINTEHTISKSFLESLELCAVASCVIMHQADDLSGSQWREIMESMCTPNGVIMSVKLSNHLCKSESSLQSWAWMKCQSAKFSWLNNILFSFWIVPRISETTFSDMKKPTSVHSHTLH